MFQRHGQRAVWLKLLTTAFPLCCLVDSRHTARRTISTSKRSGAGSAAGGSGLEQVTGWGWWLHWFALLARCAALFACLVCCFVLAFGCLCPCWVHSSFGKRHPVWFVCCASRGHRFALGTGGLKQSLLVGGIGPVYSLPKCFSRGIRPRLAPRAPFNNNPAGTVGFCRRHGGNH